MLKKTFLSICLLLCALWLSGCAVNRATASLGAGADLSKIKSVYVVKQPKDGRGIDELIKVSLEKKGFLVTRGPELQGPYHADVAVTYADKWMWDLTMYMIELTINLRDPNNNFPIAKGNSYHTSLTRKSPEAMVEEVLDNIFTATPKP